MGERNPAGEPKVRPSPGTLQGTVERITYVNEETGYVVARLEVPGRKELVTVVGNLASVSPGETLRLYGRWIIHPRYGKQFQAERYESVVPATLTGIEKYLGSGLIKGIGPIFARRLVEAFGLDTFRVIEEEPHQLLKVEGIGPIRKARIVQSWAEQREIREVMVFLQSHGVSTAYAVKIFKAYGSRAISIVKENPYRLAQDIHGIGFVTADRIAQALGIPKDSPLRVQAGILYVLHELADEGHVYAPYGELMKRCRVALEVDESLLAQAVETLQREGRIIVEEREDGAKAIYLEPLHVAEVNVARRLLALAQTPFPKISIDVERAIAWAEQQQGFSFAEAQKEAIRKALTTKVLVITGGPGTGKTTILRAIVAILEKKKLNIALAAPTGRAAKRMSEATGREAKTLHRLLEWSPQEGRFLRNQERPLEVDLVAVDECSMIDILLMNSLLRALPLQAILILVGDADQLPSVGPGTVFRDIIASGAIPVVALREIFRQARESLIVVNAHRVNNGLMPILPAEGKSPSRDFLFIPKETPEEIFQEILTLVGQRLPREFGLDPLEEVQVLSPMHKGIIGAAQLNQALQNLLNPHGRDVRRGASPFRVGDKVMQIRNNYEKEVFNGDIGRIVGVDLEDQEVVVRFEDRTVSYDFTELDELVLAYAISVHKSQGSEYPAVILPLHPSHYVMLQRNLLYTAITRGKRLVVLVGTKKALVLAVKTVRTQKRWSHLEARLRSTSLSFP
ncbi:MAG: ATP-dependent RecD-like DNA helicase [Armatimonadota bacterium]|nr:ATP-dependent RecD-like DNA helicase [Armatimonadota bacterium]